MRSQATSLGTAIESKIQRALPRLHAWYRKHHRPLPWRTRPTPYRTAVAEFMCQQTRIATVIPYYQRWMQAFPGWDRLAKASFYRVLRMWEGLGYYRRARFLHSLACAVVRLPGKELPAAPDLLRQLPGIGDYTAGPRIRWQRGARARPSRCPPRKVAEGRRPPGVGGTNGSAKESGTPQPSSHGTGGPGLPPQKTTLPPMPFKAGLPLKKKTAIQPPLPARTITSG
ncbi:hypothetical protein EBZ02_02230 [bacterium]|nr:hypothetical protein [bacterium]